MNFSETEINNWGKMLTMEGHLGEAIEVLKLNVSLNPNSTDALGSLGQAYEKNGLKESAVSCYKKLLEKAPDNEFAKGRLAKLE